jgi:hypothetical protein
MIAALAREVFSTSKLSEFCSRQGLVTATGCPAEDRPLYVAKQLVDNALDDAEEHDIVPAISIEIAADRITRATTIRPSGRGSRSDPIADDRIRAHTVNWTSLLAPCCVGQAGLDPMSVL